MEQFSPADASSPYSAPATQNTFRVNPAQNNPLRLNPKSRTGFVSDSSQMEEGANPLEETVSASRDQEAEFKEFLRRSADLGPTSEMERSMDEEKFFKREASDAQCSAKKKPFGGYALQMLYLRYLFHFKCIL